MTSITVRQAQQYASHAGFSSSVLVAGTPYSQRDTIVGIAQAESGLDPSAVNPNDPNGGSFGILQINGAWFGSGGASKSLALDPGRAFQFAYTNISRQGSDFSAWSTFTSGAYKKFLSSLDSQTSPLVFHLPSNGWWSYPNMGNWNKYPDAQGNYPTPDLNVILPPHFPIAAILPGTITDMRSGSSPSYGAVVTVKLDQPLNNLATHYAMLHLQSLQPGLSVGMHVNVGNILGYGGGNISAGSAPAAVGFALYPGDIYGVGPEWNKYFQIGNNSIDSRLDPTPLLNGAKSGTVDLAVYAASTGNNTNNFSYTDFQLPTIIPDATVQQFLYSVDQYFRVINPIPDPNKLDKIAGNIPNPIQWISEFFYNLFVVDLVGLLFRGILILLGIYICFRVIQQAVGINIPSTAKNVFQGTQSMIGEKLQ